MKHQKSYNLSVKKEQYLEFEAEAVGVNRKDLYGLMAELQEENNFKL